MKIPWFMFKTSRLGCGPPWWPDRWRPMFFHGACVDHDKCYQDSGMTQLECDDAFIKSMLEMSGTDRNRRSEAGVMFAAVAKYGHRFRKGLGL